MARTVGSCIQNARVILQDLQQPFRVSDDEMYSIFSNAVTEARRLRPDLFFASLRSPLLEYTSANATDAFPVDEQYYRAFVDYIVSEAETRNEEYTTDARAAAMLALFTQRLIGQGV